MRSLLIAVLDAFCVCNLPWKYKYRGRRIGAFAQTIPILTSGSLQPTLGIIAHVISGSVTAPDGTVRTVQQAAVITPRPIKTHKATFVRILI